MVLKQKTSTHTEMDRRTAQVAIIIANSCMFHMSYSVLLGSLGRSSVFHTQTWTDRQTDREDHNVSKVLHV